MIKLVALLKAREVYILEGEGSDFYLLEGEGDGFYLLEGEGGGGNGGGASKGEKQEGGAGKTGDQVSERNSGVDIVREQIYKITRNLGS